MRHTSKTSVRNLIIKEGFLTARSINPKSWAKLTGILLSSKLQRGWALWSGVVRRRVVKQSWIRLRRWAWWIVSSWISDYFCRIERAFSLTTQVSSLKLFHRISLKAARLLLAPNRLQTGKEIVAPQTTTRNSQIIWKSIGRHKVWERTILPRKIDLSVEYPLTKVRRTKVK